AGSSSPKQLTAAGSTVFFVANDGTADKLWMSDGSPKGTVEVPGNAGAPLAPGSLLGINGVLFFVGIGDTTYPGSVLWPADGSQNGTTFLADFPASPDPSVLTNIGGLLVFRATDGTHGFEPWVSDGLPGGTRMIEDVASGPTSSGVGSFQSFGSDVFVA